MSSKYPENENIEKAVADKLYTANYQSDGYSHQLYRLSRFFVALPVLLALKLFLSFPMNSIHFSLIFIGDVCIAMLVRMLWLQGLNQELKAIKKLALFTWLTGFAYLILLTLNIAALITIAYAIIGLALFTILTLAMVFMITSSFPDESKSIIRLSYLILPVTMAINMISVWLIDEPIAVILGLGFFFYSLAWLSYAVYLISATSNYYKFNRFDLRLAMQHCPECDYDLSSHQEIKFSCPECGREMFRKPPMDINYIDL